MCSICNELICPTACPNYREKGIYKCSECGDGISIGEELYKIKNNFYHKDCLFESYDKESLLSLIGITPSIAKKPDIICLFIGGENGKQSKHS